MCPLSELDVPLGVGEGCLEEPQELFPSGIGEPAGREGPMPRRVGGGSEQGPVNFWT